MLDLIMDRRQFAAVEYAASCVGVAEAGGELVAFLAQHYLDRPDKVRKEAVGAQELDAADFQKFAKACPKCGFEWDD